MPDSADFFGSLIFGAIGLGALIFGKNVGSPKKMILGGLLMGYTYFIDQSLLLWLIGGLLTAALVLWRD